MTRVEGSIDGTPVKQHADDNLRVLVLGARGFIGDALVEFLSSLPSIDVRSDRHSRIDYAHDDPPTLDGVNVVVNAVGRAHVYSDLIEPLYTSNVLAARRIASASASAGVQHLVLLSSLAAEDDTDQLTPSGVYGLTKRLGELETLRACASGKTRVTIVRPAGVYSGDAPGGWGQVWRRVISRRIVISPKQGPGRPVVSLEALLDSLALVISGDRSAPLLRVTDPTLHTISSFATKVADQHALRPRVVTLPGPLERLAAALLPRTISWVSRLLRLLSTATDFIGQPEANASPAPEATD